MTQPTDILPLSPIGLNKVRSAGYVGVGTTKFDEMVSDGRMPKPKRVDGRLIWYRHALEESFVALPSDDDANPWDQEDVA